jgi:ankyrin repeat protein
VSHLAQRSPLESQYVISDIPLHPRDTLDEHAISPNTANTRIVILQQQPQVNNGANACRVPWTKQTRSRSKHDLKSVFVAESTRLLLSAASEGNLAQVQELIEGGVANVNYCSSISGTPLTEACRIGCALTVEALLRYGADCKQPDASGKTPLHVSVLHNKDTTILEMLLQNGNAHIDTRIHIDGRSALHLASQLLDCSFVKVLLSAGATVDAADDRGGTPLLLACLRSHVDVVRELLMAGASVNCTDRNGSTTLMLACANRMWGCEMLELLVEAGVSCEALNKQGYSAFNFALNSNARIVRGILV